MTSPVVQKFEELVLAAEALVADVERTREPEFEAVLRHVLAHPEYRSFFAERFPQILVAGGTDGALFEYCMHELRWAEVEDEVRRMMEAAASAGDRRLQFFLGSGPMECFQDEWRRGGTGYARFDGRGAR